MSGSELELVIENTFIRSAYAKRFSGWKGVGKGKGEGEETGAHLLGAGSPKTKQGPDAQQRRL